jgi:hypothetical protein
MTYRIIFTATSTSDLTFVDSTVATDGGLTVVLKNGERVFAVPTANVIAVERAEPKSAPIPMPEPMPVPAGDVQNA